MSLWVIVPAYDEARGITATLDALAAQQDPAFTVLVVDNGSRDGTGDVVRAHDRGLDLRVVDEPVKGTGAAADTGMRHAIGAGATLLARTDADCLPAPGWTAALREGFADGLELIGGRLVPRTDEVRLRWWERRGLPAVVAVAAAFGRLRPSNRDPAFRGPYVMCPGCNLAITAAMYRRSGGFPRTAIEDVHEDRALVNAVRRAGGRIGRRRDAVVAGSVRRVRAYGLVGTLGWYADHRHRPAVVDVR
ncbi:glycosyltransferase family A protein [Actinomycetospora rhizophila]|uniref:4,4'-diaponeurosporenoate glycosyltransferase n=1 Tax=Actinomycetospora rhizophila TaxID=1416876 RepID=A0ABV9ZJ42_9PSEU